MKLNLSPISSFSAPLRLTLFILMLLGLWLPLAVPIYLLGDDPNTVSIITLLLLYLEFIVLVRFWGKWIDHQPKLLQHYGLRLTSQNAWLFILGLSWGCLSLLSLFAFEAQLGWLTWYPNSQQFPRVILEGLLVAFGIGFAEELFFRGWLLDELLRDYSFSISAWVCSGIYAIAHFIKPVAEILRTWLQFPGLILLGLIFVWAKFVISSPSEKIPVPRGNLGLPIGLHGGLVWGYYIISVGGKVQYSGRVPDWVVGIDQNPLAGLTGLIFLSAIAILIRKLSRFRN
ncbi:abortive phage infection protein [Limnoraphis robusta CS-951]|uniref:Abortive phage infection protein n=2 Tax=Limnoraphis TaxID=1332112 RepID=A0A0F5Y832_9CYAN|nr:abortive phage infection protein [Limnoraphis robusta CS-951]